MSWNSAFLLGAVIRKQLALVLLGIRIDPTQQFGVPRCVYGLFFLRHRWRDAVDVLDAVALAGNDCFVPPPLVGGRTGCGFLLGRQRRLPWWCNLRALAGAAGCGASARCSFGHSRSPGHRAAAPRHRCARPCGFARFLSASLADRIPAPGRCASAPGCCRCCAWLVRLSHPAAVVAASLFVLVVGVLVLYSMNGGGEVNDPPSFGCFGGGGGGVGVAGGAGKGRRGEGERRRGRGVRLRGCCRRRLGRRPSLLRLFRRRFARHHPIRLNLRLDVRALNGVHDLLHRDGARCRERAR